MAATHYDTLGVYPTSSADEIATAYKALMARFQAEYDSGNFEVRDRMFFARSAYEVLSNKISREMYNVTLASNHLSTNAARSRVEGSEVTPVQTEQPPPKDGSGEDSFDAPRTRPPEGDEAAIDLTYEDTSFSKRLGLAGSLILIVGVFLPIVSAPIMGRLNYFRNGEGDGILILLLAAFSVFFVLRGETRRLIYTGIGSMAILAMTLGYFIYKFQRMKTEISEDMKGNMFGGIATAMVQSVNLEWGWIILFMGAMLVVCAGIAAKHGVVDFPALLDRFQSQLGVKSAARLADTRQGVRRGGRPQAREENLPPQSAPIPYDAVGQLERLARLKETNAISEFEFEKLKRAVLDRAGGN